MKYNNFAQYEDQLKNFVDMNTRLRSYVKLGVSCLDWVLLLSREGPWALHTHTHTHTHTQSLYVCHVTASCKVVGLSSLRMLGI
jgi:hypothetical protein